MKNKLFTDIDSVLDNSYSQTVYDIVMYNYELLSTAKKFSRINLYTHIERLKLSIGDTPIDMIMIRIMIELFITCEELRDDIGLFIDCIESDVDIAFTDQGSSIAIPDLMNRLISSLDGVGKNVFIDLNNLLKYSNPLGKYIFVKWDGLNEVIVVHDKYINLYEYNH
jgi:hypothetical protein